MDVMVIDRPGKNYNNFELNHLKELQSMSAEQGIGFLRLELATNPYDVYSFDGKTLGHFNYKGHEIAASELYAYFGSAYQNVGLLESKRTKQR